MERSRADDRLLPAVVPATARVAVSPSALVLAGAGAGLSLLFGLPVLAAVAVGAGFWGVRVGVGAALSASRHRVAQRPEVIDAYAVPEPWRSFVRESLTAQAKFDQTVAHSRPGPLQDRLGDVSGRVRDGVRECSRVAHLGAGLDATRAALNVEATSSQLRRFQQTRVTNPPASPDATRAQDETEAALAAQVQAARRLEAAGRRATDRLRVLTAQLNVAVAGAVEISLDAGDTAAARQLAGEVDSVVSEIETLRRALEESRRTDGPTAGPSIRGIPGPGGGTSR